VSVPPSRLRSVLVVDDSAFMRKVIAEMITESGIFRVAGTARNGLDALRQIHALEPDIVTLDIEMPELDGLETLGYVMSETPRPVVMLSAAGTAGGTDLTLRALELGAVDFVRKPSGPVSLDLATVRDRLLEALRAASCMNIGGVGMLAEDNAATRQLELAGVHRIPVKDAMTALFRALDLDDPVIAVMDVDWSAWISLFPAVKAIPRFAALALEASSATASHNYAASLLAAPVAERLPLLTQAIIGLVAEALHMPADKIDRHQPLSGLGIDSLIGVELQSAIASRLGMRISILQLMKGGNIEEMATVLLQKMTTARPAEAPPAPVAPPPIAAAEPAPGMSEMAA